MRLIPCPTPNGSLEPAPRTALCGDTRDEHWDGFWAADEKYYARCTHADGQVHWYRVADESRPVTAAGGRVLQFPRRDTRADRPAVQRMLLLWGPSGRRPMLVGTRPPRASAQPGVPAGHGARRIAPTARRPEREDGGAR